MYAQSCRLSSRPDGELTIAASQVLPRTTYISKMIGIAQRNHHVAYATSEVFIVVLVLNLFVSLGVVVSLPVR